MNLFYCLHDIALFCYTPISASYSSLPTPNNFLIIYYLYVYLGWLASGHRTLREDNYRKTLVTKTHIGRTYKAEPKGADHGRKGPLSLLLALLA